MNMMLIKQAVMVKNHTFMLKNIHRFLYVKFSVQKLKE
jgi:hypothetical protein